MSPADTGVSLTASCGNRIPSGISRSFSRLLGRYAGRRPGWIDWRKRVGVEPPTTGDLPGGAISIPQWPPPPGQFPTPGSEFVSVPASGPDALAERKLSLSTIRKTNCLY